MVGGGVVQVWRERKDLIVAFESERRMLFCRVVWTHGRVLIRIK